MLESIVGHGVWHFSVCMWSGSGSVLFVEQAYVPWWFEWMVADNVVR